MRELKFAPSYFCLSSNIGRILRVRKVIFSFWTANHPFLFISKDITVYYL